MIYPKVSPGSYYAKYELGYKSKYMCKKECSEYMNKFWPGVDITISNINQALKTHWRIKYGVTYDKDYDSYYNLAEIAHQVQSHPEALH